MSNEVFSIVAYIGCVLLTITNYIAYRQYKITSVGRKMAKYPIDPPLAKTLLVSEELGCQQEVATIAALLSTQLHSLFKKGRKGGSKSQIDSVKTRLGQDSSGDHLLFLNIFQHYEDNNFSEYWCSQNFLNQRILDEAREIRAQLLEILSRCVWFIFNEIILFPRKVVNIESC